MMASHQGKEYRFLFVRADGMQLEKITRMVETEKIVPQIDSRKFDLLQINDAVRLVISVDIYPDGVYNANTLWGYFAKEES